MPRSVGTCLLLAAAFAITVLSASAVLGEPSSTEDSVTVQTQQQNVGDAQIAALAYHRSDDYESGLNDVAAKAGAWIKIRAPQVAKPALVLDIDETALSNWRVIVRDDFGRPIAGNCDLALDAPCGWAAWDQLGHDPAIAPTLTVFRQALAAKVSVFFITGRPESQRAATERNLVEAGYVGYIKSYFLPKGARYASAAEFKADTCGDRAPGLRDHRQCWRPAV